MTRDPEMVAFGQRMKQARRSFIPRLSQEKAAERLGWSQQKYSKMENGNIGVVTIADVRRLATLLRVDDYWLFTGRHASAVGPLAGQVDRLDLDEWGEQAVLETARREAQRVADQREQFDLIQRQMLAADIPPETTSRAMQLARSIEHGTAFEESPSPPTRQEGRAQGDQRS